MESRLTASALVYGADEQPGSKPADRSTISNAQPDLSKDFAPEQVRPLGEPEDVLIRFRQVGKQRLTKRGSNVLDTLGEVVEENDRVGVGMIDLTVLKLPTQ